jgi:hypothetical protein
VVNQKIRLRWIGFGDPLIDEHRRIFAVLQVFAGLLQVRNYAHLTLKGGFNGLCTILSSIG